MKKKDSVFIVESESLLLPFLLLNVKNKSKNNIKSQLARGNVLVGGKSITKHDYMLQKGQKVIIKWSQIYDKDYEEVLDIIYEDKDIIVINKPAGLLSVSTNNEHKNTVYHMVMTYLKRNNLKNRIYIVHRLDRETSGVLLLAKNEKIKFALQDNWSELVSIRGYISIVEGNVEQDEGIIKSWLKETSTLLVYSSHKTGDGQEAITHYKKIRSRGKYSLLDIRLDTGRKNQIRVHMKDIKHSIVGDKKYGSKLDPLKRLGLHANILEFKHPLSKKIMHFEAPIPEEFKSLF
ncbi:MAG: RluA family pseudouridine synthase [Bacilli bacterium]|nr:RluA family pseudouridine synthase [Bacilli bacterium]MDD3304892.1 RluA family pseudouridine synthase [Bacilli bacterium]MDD4053508.1 RluA family pseudouridine synthase [Bacilli bacterium]MDD4411543.1 RluA family pseudouridine synthase [Bacilli bacterium]